MTQLEQEEEDEKDRLYKKWEEESDHSHWGSGCPCSWEADYFDFEEEVLKEREEDPWYPKCPDYVEPIDIDVGVKLYQL